MSGVFATSATANGPNSTANLSKLGLTRRQFTLLSGSALLAACVVKGGVKGIGLAGPGQPTDPNTYQVFVPVDWQTAAVSLRPRRAATNDVELIEVNGVAPSPRAILTNGSLAGPTRTQRGRSAPASPRLSEIPPRRRWGVRPRLAG